MMASIPRRVKRAFGSLMSAAGVVGLIGLPKALGAWAKLIAGVDSTVVYVVVYLVLVSLGCAIVWTTRKPKHTQSDHGATPPRREAGHESSPAHRPSAPTPIEQGRKATSRASVRDRLQALLDEGVALDQRMPAASAMGTTAMAALGHIATENDVRLWEARVEHELKAHPQMLSLLRYDPPEPLALMVLGLTFGSPAKKRLSRRLVALEKVILDMPRAA